MELLCMVAFERSFGGQVCSSQPSASGDQTVSEWMIQIDSF